MSISLRSSAVKVAAAPDISNHHKSYHPQNLMKNRILPPVDEEEDDFDEALDKITIKDLHMSRKTSLANNQQHISETVMIEGVKEVEVKSRERELNTITISSISVSKLPLVSKYNKNEPWLKVTYGTSHSWSSLVSLITDERGTTAEWDDLNYEFILPPQDDDRCDLTIAICSQKIVLGRYILQAKNFLKIPHADVSEFFEVKGKITNSLGKAGRLVMICRHGKAENKQDKENHDKKESNILFAPKPHQAVNYNDIDKIYVKVLSIVLVDMPDVHHNESNSPLVTISCGSWEKKTNIDYNSGNMSRWNKLYWKVILGRLDILSFTVTSHTRGGCDVIGTVGVAIDDLLPDKVGTDGVVIIVRYMTDGTNITGKIRIRLQIRYPTAIATLLNNAASNAAGIQRRNSLLLSQTQAEAAAAGRRPSLTSATSSLSAGRIAVTAMPFKLTILSITAVDLKPRHTLFANSPYVNAVYGSWGQGTEVISGAGACASWANLNWAMSINEEHHLELNAWSRGLSIGAISLSPKFLLHQPIDKFGRVTLLLKLTDENHVTSGKLKVTCMYHPDVSEFSLESELQKQKAIDEMVNLGLFYVNHTSGVHLPASARVVAVAVMDLASVHVTKPNSPRVKLACDRQVAATTIAVRGGAHVQWQGMEWKFDIHQGSFLILAVTSDEKLIGTLELSAKTIISFPPNQKNVVEITCPITSTSGSITGRIKLSLKLSSSSSAAAPVVPGRVAISPHADPSHFFDNDYHASIASLITNKLFLYIDMHHIQVHDLKLKSNLLHSISSSSSSSQHHKGLWISLSYGKYHESTKEISIPSSSSPKSSSPSMMRWDELHWQFKVKEDYSLRMVLHSGDGIMLGSLSISPQTLFSASSSSSSNDDLAMLTETFYDENHAVARVSVAYRKVVLKDWCNDFSAVEHGPNGYKAANRAAMMGALASAGSNISSSISNSLLPPIFEGDGLGSIEEEDDDADAGAWDDDDDMEFPMVAHMQSFHISSFNYHHIIRMLHHHKKPPLPPSTSSSMISSSMSEWLSKNILGIASYHHDDHHKDDDSIQCLPKDTKLCVRMEIHGGHNSNNAGAKGSRWSYETHHVSCSDDGMTVHIDDDVKIPLLSMFTEINITIFFIIPSSSPSSSSMTSSSDVMMSHVLGTCMIIAEDFADIPRDTSSGHSIITRSISRGSASMARLSMNCRLRPTSLQLLYQQHFQVLPPSSTSSSTSPPMIISSSYKNDDDKHDDDHHDDDDHEPESEADMIHDTSSSSRRHSLIAPMQRLGSMSHLMHHLSSPTASSSSSNDHQRSGMMQGGKPYQFDIATDENAIGRLFGNRSPALPKSSSKPHHHDDHMISSLDGEYDDVESSKIIPTKKSLITTTRTVLSKPSSSSFPQKTNDDHHKKDDDVIDEDEDDDHYDDDMMSVGAFNQATPDINYAEEARRRRYSELISGVYVAQHQDDDHSIIQDLSSDEDDDDTYDDHHHDHSPAKVSNQSRRSSLQHQLSSYHHTDDNILFEKIKLSGYHIIIHNIMLIDLINAHRLKTNSPAIAITCGADLYTSTIMDDAGSMASWHHIDYTCMIHRDNDITCTVSSRGIIIGAITFTLKQLLRASSTGKSLESISHSPNRTKPSHDDHHDHNMVMDSPRGNDMHEIIFHANNESDLLTIFGDLEAEDKQAKKSAGKLKMSFKLARL